MMLITMKAIFHKLLSSKMNPVLQQHRNTTSKNIMNAAAEAPIPSPMNWLDQWTVKKLKKKFKKVAKLAECSKKCKKLGLTTKNM